MGCRDELHGSSKGLLEMLLVSRDPLPTVVSQTVRGLQSWAKPEGVMRYTDPPSRIGGSRRGGKSLSG